MLSSRQENLLSKLHACIHLDTMFELAPKTRIDPNARVTSDIYFDMQMLSDYFQRFIEQHSSSPYDVYKKCDDISKEIYKGARVLPMLVHNSATDCIEQLVKDKAANSEDIIKFILGYSAYIPHKSLHKKIGKTLQEHAHMHSYLWGL